MLRSLLLQPFLLAGFLERVEPLRSLLLQPFLPAGFLERVEHVLTLASPELHPPLLSFFLICRLALFFRQFSVDSFLLRGDSRVID